MSNVHGMFENNSFMDRHTSWATIQHLHFAKKGETKVCLMQKKVVMCSLKLDTKITFNARPSFIMANSILRAKMTVWSKA